jgi:hypothetical protein
MKKKIGVRSRARRFLRACVLLALWASAIPGVSLLERQTAFAKTPPSCDFATGFYCGDNCQVYQKKYGWGLNTTTTTPSSAITGHPVMCPPGYVRIRQINSEGYMTMTCVNLEGCGGNSLGTTIKVCAYSNSGGVAWGCAYCTQKINGPCCGTQNANGSCAGAS